jgi:hypothetical protein
MSEDECPGMHRALALAPKVVGVDFQHNARSTPKFVRWRTDDDI